MNINPIPLLNYYENINNDFSFNQIFKERLLETDYPKETCFHKDFQEKNELFPEEPKFNSELIIDSSLMGSTQDASPTQNKSISQINSTSPEDDKKQNLKQNSRLFFTEISKDKEFKKTCEDKLLMNRISARKSRLKKKQYIKCLEEETANLKNQIILNEKIGINSNNLLSKNIDEDNNEEKNKIFFNKMILLEKQEKEVKREGQKKKINIMKQHEVLKKIFLKEMLVKQIHYFLPLQYQIFGEKFIKLVQIYEDDSISVIITKVNENLQKIKNYLNVVSKKRIKLVIRFYEIYKKIKNFTDNFHQLFIESFKL
jgi:hypothetical protein